MSCLCQGAQLLIWARVRCIKHSGTAAKEQWQRERSFPKLSVLVTNFRSLFNKQDLVCSFFEPCPADFVLGTETCISSDISDYEWSLANHFVIFRKDRTVSRGIGVMIAVKKNLQARLVDTFSSIEILCVIFRLSASVSCAVGVCYRPHVSSPNSLSTWTNPYVWYKTNTQNTQ